MSFLTTGDNTTEEPGAAGALAAGAAGAGVAATGAA